MWNYVLRNHVGVFYAKHNVYMKNMALKKSRYLCALIILIYHMKANVFGWSVFLGKNVGIFGNHVGVVCMLGKYEKTKTNSR